ncbi:MAG: hypothetical protein AB4352_09990 [Hormoscilla sp.]
MKCIQCDTDNNLKDRTANQGRCKNCGHPFVFDPKAGSKFTDIFFNNALKAISVENTLYFTPKQVFYALERRLKKSATEIASIKFSICVIVCWVTLGTIWTIGQDFLPAALWAIESLILIISSFKLEDSNSKKKNKSSRINQVTTAIKIAKLGLIVGIVISLTLSSIPVVGVIVFIVSITLGLGLIYFGQRQLSRISSYGAQPLSVKPSDVDIWVNRWTQVNEIPKMLPTPNEETTSVAVSPDITAYSFDRVVVCDRAAIAQFLIANNFHFENNCAVLSISGYPQSIFSTVLKMLRRNPNLKVYVLHNASPGGVSLVHRLGSSPNWFANSNVPIYDLGLLPRHVFASKNMLVRRSPEFAQTARQLPEPVRQSLSKDEIKWLEMGNYVELEFFTPQRLLQVVTQGIARSRELGSDDSMTSIYGDDDNTSAMIFASDSFG